MHRPIRRPALFRTLAVLVAATAAIAAAPAGAVPSGEPGRSPLASLGHARDAGAGLYRVPVGGGESLLTHGPDPAPQGAAARSRLPVVPERPPLCATDHYQHVLVGRLSGTPDRLAQAAGEVRATVGRINGTLNRDALESGGVNADFKVLCDGGGTMRVDSFASPSADFDDIVRAARAAGFGSSNADYTIFFDAPSAGDFCGVASFVADERLVIANASNTGGGYAVVYQPCWHGEAPMHEIAHNQGAVQYSAPHSTGNGGHCNQIFDVICYAPDGGDRNQTLPSLVCPEAARFDCGYDDYFDAAPEPGEYLATHWNLGSPLNRFIAFRPPESPPAEPPPETACERAACATRLRLGVPRRGVGGVGETALYRLRIPAHASALRIDLSAEAPLEVWARHEALPGPAYACRQRRRARTATCRIAHPHRGAWFLAVSGGDGATGFELLATAGRAGSR